MPLTDRSSIFGYATVMRITKAQVGLAAVVLFAPGGFLLGATLIANHYRKQRSGSPTEPPPKPPIVS